MAAHAQQQILDAMKAALVAAITAARRNVFVDRPDELSTSDVPAIVIEAGDEDVSAEGVNMPFVLTRIWNVDTICVAAGKLAAAAARDLAREVEVTLHADISAATFGGLCRPIELLAARPQLTGQSSETVAEVRQSWRITYFTRSGSPDVLA